MNKNGINMKVNEKLSTVNSQLSIVKIQFDSNQDYQLSAVDSIVNLFEGLSREELGNEEREFALNSKEDTDAIPNVDELFELNETELLDSVNEIRKANSVNSVRPLLPKPDWSDSDFNDGDTLTSDVYTSDFWRYPEFTINMETGTGKTYVYLRTIYALNQKYGFKKFIVVVPSVAIYEGAISTFNATKDHFETLFSPGTVPNSIKQYDGNVTVCKDFALSTSLEILLMTVDSFNKATNVIYKATEKIRGGKLPIHFIQETKPILILDEVQNYQTDIARRALRTLHPFFSVGYSATPGKNPTNELYRLSSYEACQRNLVKKIDVLGYNEEQIATAKEDYFKIVSINKKDLSCDVELNVLKGGKLSLQVFTGLKADGKTTFAKKSGNDKYGNLAIEKISAKENNEYVELNNGMRYCQDQASCASLSKEVVFRQMINATIQEHIKRMAQLRASGVKVLSLFFIDRVASYKGDNAVIARIFDEEFEKLKGRVSEWKNLKGSDVREGYFAQKQKPKSTEFEDIDTAIDGTKSADEKEAEKRAYNLIMREKEKLLSFDEKVCFIFAHSALREGWDNPNVFQICALREITSESNRRQTIGRGLRLPVNQQGIRIHDATMNRLTVIANESYSRFVGKLQEEYIADGVMTPPQITNKRHTESVHRTVKFNSDEFEDIWRKANRRTEYKINIITDELVKEAVTALNAYDFEGPKLVCTKGSVVITIYDIKLEAVSEDCEAKVTISKRDDTQNVLFEGLLNQFILKKGDVVGKVTGNALEKCPELAALKVTEIKYDKNNPERSSITFSKIDNPLLVGEKITHETTSGHSSTTNDISDFEYPDVPKCNIIARAAKEVNITRKTILKIFKSLEQKKIEDFMKNPEGFTSQFIAVLREVVANHIAKNIEYTKADGSINDDKDVLFPPEEEHPTTELVDANLNRTIYDKIQVDSDVERNFVGTLNTCDANNGAVMLYFKFPPKYKINLPHIIGNYNPDWAIVRRDEQDTQIEIVRETKGTEDLTKLWHSNEGRKIVCAQKHFKAVGIEYKFVDDKDPYWYVPNKENYSEVLFGDKNTLLEKAKKQASYNLDSDFGFLQAAEPKPPKYGAKKE
nr:DEAD/DEAH box helicase family protein [uncultured Treponema sp.]